MDNNSPRRRMDFQPRRQPTSRSSDTGNSTPSQSVQSVELPPIPREMPSPSSQKPALNAPKKSKKRLIAKLLLVLVGLIAVAAIAAFVWYRYELSPVSGDTEKQVVTIEAGTSPRGIAAALKKKGLIRSEAAFYLYLLESGQRDALQAGVYRLAPSQSSRDIVKELASGAVSEASVTFYPGAVLDVGQEGSSSTSVATQLRAAGFTDEEIKAAFAATYDEPTLFAGKPASAGLEGYIYGDTYRYSENASAESLIKTALDEFSKVVVDNNLAAAYKKHGLTLFQGITLASIIQREVTTESSEPTSDQKIVAQIFLSRLKRDEVLGSDVTYLYGAAISGQTPSPTLDSPYNTRKVKGLPPGPIAVPGRGALLAVANPANTDYTYFLSGDDDKTYFAKTEDEHHANIAAHCQQKCSEN